MAHRIRIQSDEQHIAALNVLDFTRGTWLEIGPSSAPEIIVTDDQYDALVKAGVVSENGEKVNAHAKKATRKKNKS